MPGVLGGKELSGSLPIGRVQREGSALGPLLLFDC
jgi:hypothetical protein